MAVFVGGSRFCETQDPAERSLMREVKSNKRRKAGYQASWIRESHPDAEELPGGGGILKET